MKIISHRGYWKTAHEKNTEVAFRRSFDLSFGVETDVRDCCGKIVISHDMPIGSELEFDCFVDVVSQYGAKHKMTIALNIKSDGMADMIKGTLDRYKCLDYFAFDMSIPDMRSYIEIGVPVFSRISDYEKEPVFADMVSGFWVDSFESDWFDDMFVNDLLQGGKTVCIVSPELHKREYLKLWARLRLIEHNENLILCTDYPVEAHSFFMV